MKTALGTIGAAFLLSGCLATNPLKKEDSPAPAASTAPAETSQPAAPVAAKPAETVPCKPEAPAKPAKGKANSKAAKTKGKPAQKTAAKDTAAAPCTAESSANAAPVKAEAQPAAQQANASGSRREVKGINDWTGYIDGKPVAGSKFGKLQVGMGQKEVTDLAGQPTDQSSHVTGKAWIPFYFGSGTYETWYYYKGVGRLLFAGNGGFSSNTGLVGIEYDASEKGYAR